MNKKTFLKSRSNIILAILALVAVILILRFAPGISAPSAEKQQKDKTSFLKEYVAKHPNAGINECTSATGVKSLRITSDVGPSATGSELYSFEGKQIAMCPFTPTGEIPAACNERADCTQVFYPAGKDSAGVDTYHIKS